MKNIALVGDLDLARKFLLALEQFKSNIHHLKFNIKNQEIIFCPTSHIPTCSKHLNCEAIIWFLSCEPELDKKVADYISKMPANVCIEIYDPEESQAMNTIHYILHKLSNTTCDDIATQKQPIAKSLSGLMNLFKPTQKTEAEPAYLPQNQNQSLKH